MHTFANLYRKSRKFNFKSLFSLLGTTTHLIYQIDQANGNSRQPWPPMMHPQLGDSFTTLLRKPYLYSLTPLLAYLGF